MKWYLFQKKLGSRTSTSTRLEASTRNLFKTFVLTNNSIPTSLEIRYYHINVYTHFFFIFLSCWSHLSSIHISHLNQCHLQILSSKPIWAFEVHFHYSLNLAPFYEQSVFRSPWSKIEIRRVDKIQSCSKLLPQVEDSILHQLLLGDFKTVFLQGRNCVFGYCTVWRNSCWVP